MSFEESDMRRLEERAHRALANDELTPAELALLPRRFGDIGGPRARYRRDVRNHRLRMAATFGGLLVGAAVLGPPLSAAVSRWVGEDAAPAAPTVVAESARAAETPAPTHTEYSFEPARERIGARFDRPMAGASLTVGVTDGRLVVFTVERREAAPTVVVTPNGVRVQNAAAQTRYRILLPPSVTVVDVDVDGLNSRSVLRPTASETEVSLGGVSPSPDQLR